jgi:hypothetical protein
LVPTVDGTLEEVLASMAVQESHANPNNITWMVAPETYFHVVIFDEQDRWLVQTHTTGSFGFYIGTYIVNKETDDGNIHIVKGTQYYLYFRNQGIKVPFKVEGKI